MSIAEQSALWAENTRDHGAEAAAQASSEWTRLAEIGIGMYRTRGWEFTADNIRDLVGPPPSDNAMGALFLNASKAGLIQFVGYQRSSRIQRHAARIAVWRGAA